MKAGYTEHKVLIWGKTYPELSKKYIETVCTAGVLESGKPVRLYPITYRYLDDEQFRLYQWITAGLVKNPNDARPESYKIDCDSIILGETLPATADEWGKRGEFMFKDKTWQFGSVDDLQQAQKKDRTFIGIVAPREIMKVEAADRSEEDARSFDQKFDDLKRSVEAERAQIQMFEDAIPPEMKKLEFLRSRVMVSWLCKGKNCSGHRMQVLDWGLCELQRREGSEAAVNRMKELCNLKNYDLKFFLGNLFQYPTSFLIVGMWYPKRREDMFRW
ncbi:MAG: hypothetical protein WA213_18925 [Terriglobales bacterium]